MGIAPYKTFTFDGESSGDYGVYITGTGVFNAPERSVEMVEIAGRNGSFALDKGKFENIEVTYRVGIVDDSEADFADRVSDFRNWLCSKVGYCRLEDEYNPNEYRMAVYASGMELEHDLLIAGEAEITFNCKPQRWLTSGETDVSVADGGTIDNPTLFEASPLLMVWGYGNININDDDPIGIQNAPYGKAIKLCNSKFLNNQTSITTTFPVSQLAPNDAIYQANNMPFNIGFNLYASDNYVFPEREYYSESYYFYPLAESDTFAFGVFKTYSDTISITDYIYTLATPNTHLSFTISLDYIIQYDGNDTITFSFSNASITGAGAAYIELFSTRIRAAEIWADSSVIALGTPMYIDLDIGEAYNLDSGDIITINSSVTLPNDLPVLKVGTNTITYDNTISQFKIVPRWWKV